MICSACKGPPVGVLGCMLGDGGCTYGAVRGRVRCVRCTDAIVLTINFQVGIGVLLWRESLIERHPVCEVGINVLPVPQLRSHI